ncbi:glycoside hydrolase family 3 protein [Flavobacterium gawalongense]|uniref:beta-glucosidase n=1 Tax=Flavobacterium gawalongense TaxID=2594432 RepID=A0A553BSL6_9FLAO|nr:glycoside hydrolase family 3 N-terminal domain-containing protein [Flavobacterium gawalongense]TRX11233.1 glycoside hydrolase family 3 protein [Flavobacterium gawalongense]TRX12306.1 glycoside hydrolase family 3 protein [Flavobacterium gawalongense]TRX30155.1 glycoside hydrolase family 3 protein [Flavobacterium gawalongense]
MINYHINITRILSFTLVSFATFAQSPIQPKLENQGVQIIKSQGYEFKDLNKNGKLDKYEDWRLPNETRVKDLISQMTLEEKVGFMLISTTRMEGDYAFQQDAPKAEIKSGFNEEDLVQNINMFSKKPLPAPVMSAVGTTKAVTQYNLRHFILRANTTAKNMAEWSNNLQRLCESSRLGIPAIVASNPRNHITVDASLGLSVGTTIFSKWPGELGLAAMRDLELTREFADIARQEWAAVGLRKGYMYMADLATEPRWQRVEGTFGENADLAASMIREITLGFQKNKLGTGSVALTTKHFPGGGPQVDGQDPHFVWGQDQHYPGNMFDYHLKPFQAAIDAGTSAIMPYYAKPVNTKYEAVAFAYNKAIINDLLRVKMGFKGIINSDTGPIEMMPWGVENLTILERYQKAIDCGVDLFSGTGDPTLLLETVKKGMVSESRINQSIERLLTEKFELGLFENPYVDVSYAEKTVGNSEFQKRGDLAFRKSIVLLRNDAKLLPIKKGTKVYLESLYNNSKSNTPISDIQSKDWGIELVKDKKDADLVVLTVTPTAGSLFSSTGSEIKLQLSDNKIDVAYINEVTSSKPTVVVINYSNPWVIDEIDTKNLQTVLATFGTSSDALLDVLTGKYNPTGKMPFTTPKSRQAVLDNQSDVPGYLKPNGYALFKFNEGVGY